MKILKFYIWFDRVFTTQFLKSSAELRKDNLLNMIRNNEYYNLEDFFSNLAPDKINNQLKDKDDFTAALLAFIFLKEEKFDQFFETMSKKRVFEMDLEKSKEAFKFFLNELLNSIFYKKIRFQSQIKKLFSTKISVNSKVKENNEKIYFNSVSNIRLLKAFELILEKQTEKILNHIMKENMLNEISKNFEVSYLLMKIFNSKINILNFNNITKFKDFISKLIEEGFWFISSYSNFFSENTYFVNNFPNNSLFDSLRSKYPELLGLNNLSFRDLQNMTLHGRIERVSGNIIKKLLLSPWILSELEIYENFKIMLKRKIQISLQNQEFKDYLYEGLKKLFDHGNHEKIIFLIKNYPVTLELLKNFNISEINLKYAKIIIKDAIKKNNLQNLVFLIDYVKIFEYLASLDTIPELSDLFDRIILNPDFKNMIEIIHSRAFQHFFSKIYEKSKNNLSKINFIRIVFKIGKLLKLNSEIYKKINTNEIENKLKPFMIHFLVFYFNKKNPKIELNDQNWYILNTERENIINEIAKTFKKHLLLSKFEKEFLINEQKIEICLKDKNILCLELEEINYLHDMVLAIEKVYPLFYNIYKSPNHKEYILFSEVFLNAFIHNEKIEMKLESNFNEDKYYYLKDFNDLITKQAIYRFQNIILNIENSFIKQSKLILLLSEVYNLIKNFFVLEDPILINNIQNLNLKNTNLPQQKRNNENDDQKASQDKKIRLN